jgi:hypothetical protein
MGRDDTHNTAKPALGTYKTAQAKVRHLVSKAAGKARKREVKEVKGADCTNQIPHRGR